MPGFDFTRREFLAGLAAASLPLYSGCASPYGFGELNDLAQTIAQDLTENTPYDYEEHAEEGEALAQMRMDQFQADEWGETDEGAVDIPDESLLLVAEHGSGKMERLAALQLIARKRDMTLRELIEDAG